MEDLVKQIVFCDFDNNSQNILLIHKMLWISAFLSVDNMCITLPINCKCGYGG